MAKRQGSKEGIVTVRLDEAEVQQLDRVAGGKLSRSQVVRIVVQDFIAKSEQEQKEFLIRSLFQ
jgi:metal-responsive CopG/Arc/MetJ family transcriptional regulator